MARYIHFVSNDSGSLGEITQDLIDCLKDDFIITNETKEEIPRIFDILLCHFIHPSVTTSSIFNYFKYKILIQPIDGTIIKSNIVDSINKFDLIITPGNAGKEIMKKNGVKKPITVIPNFYKPEILIKPKDLSIPKLDKLINDKFIFYHESTCHPRKGIRMMCKSFVRAFSSNTEEQPVVLIIKTSPFNIVTFNDLENVKKEIVELQKQYKYPAKILKISQHLPFETLYKIWHKIDAYVSFAGIEGFGIPMLRMAVLGKPVITFESSISGYIDFLDKKSTVYTKSHMTKAAKELVPIYTEETQWTTPIDDEDCETALLDVYYNFLRYSYNKKSYSKYEYKNVIKQYKDLLNNVDKLKKISKNNRFIESDIELQ